MKVDSDVGRHLAALSGCNQCERISTQLASNGGLWIYSDLK